MSMTPVRLALSALAAAAVALAAFAAFQLIAPPVAHAQAAPSAQGPTVRIDNFTFNPDTIVVKPGTTVTWVNADDIPHTVTSTTGAFKSKVLDTDQRYSFTFTKAGEYAYFCSIHPHMTGKVIVKG